MQTQGLPSQLGVRPAPELSNQLLVQSFAWMFAAVLVTAVVAVPVIGNEAFLNFAYQRWFIITIATFALGIGVQVAIPKTSALVGLLLFFVYAAALGVTVGRDLVALHGRVRDHVVLRGGGDVRGGRDLRRDDQAQPELDRRLPVHGHDRDPGRVAS